MAGNWFRSDTWASAARLQKIGLLSLLMAVVLALIDLTLAAVPLVLMLLLLLIAPFAHRLGLFLPVISRGRKEHRTVALTFDDGPDPGSTPALLQLLSRQDVRATFFVVGRRAAEHPELIRAILDGGHTVGNHGYRHDSLVAFKGERRVAAEITATQGVLAGLGVVPAVYRPPVGITFPALGRILKRLRLTAVTFSCQAWDRGNRVVTPISKRILKRAKAGDIIMLHDSLPARPAESAQWLAEVSRVITGLGQKGLSIRPLEEIIGCAVDRRPNPGGEGGNAL